MAKKSAIRVALDLETTGLHPEQDTIIEIAAVKFQGSEVLDTFQTLVAPGRSIPYRVQRLTNITPEHLVGAPPFSSLAKKLQLFLGDFPIVGHSIPFDVAFLRQRGLARTNPLIDTFEMATVLLPSLASYNLGQVADALGLSVPADRHRAMVDTVLAMDVFLALHQRLQAVDLDLLNELANLDAPRNWPLLHFFRAELRERQERDGITGRLSRGSLGERFASQLGMNPRVLSFAIGEQSTSPTADAARSGSAAPQADSATQLASAKSASSTQLLDPPALAPDLPAGYQETRQAVSQALQQRTPLLLEVATGGNDYTPALLPALEWVAGLTGSVDGSDKPRRLVISCVSPQNARKLIDTVLPRLQGQLKSDFSVAYLAEGGGYLCTHRWFGAALRRTNGELSAEQARGLAKLLLWMQQTQTGERRELTLLQQESLAWDRICSGYERIPSSNQHFGTSYERCTYRRKGYCFVSRAEERVRAAQIVVTTHEGLFDDLSSEHSLLSEIDHRVILDVDLLEEENIRWCSADFEQHQLFQLLNTLGVELPDGRYQGLLALASPSLRENGAGGLSSTPTVAKAELDARLLRWFSSLRQARNAVEHLFLAFQTLLDEFSQQGNRDKNRAEGGQRRGHERPDQALRLSSTVRQLSVWQETESAWQLAAQRLQTVIDLAREAENSILTRQQQQRRRMELGSGEDTSVASELVIVAYQLQELLDLGKQALSLNNDNVVYWLRMPFFSPQQQHAPRRNQDAPRVPHPIEPSPVLYSQIVQPAVMLKHLLLSKPAATIFAGTALSVDNSFAFSGARLGGESLPAHALVTEHHEQTLLYLPDDVPEPNAPQYQRHLEEALVNVATALEGQTVALFTSHAALRTTYAAIKPILEARDVMVLGQGIDGSPRQLWQTFQSQERVVILGTGSFWDSTDDVPSLPACLFIARLPLPALNDPPLAARVDLYSDQLHQLAVPTAALRLRRVLNRLAWSENKRNVVVAFDRRLLSKEYGATILHSLPRSSVRQGGAAALSDTVLDWLTATGAWS
jgi:exonuclease, DNA polymerase III, epsilon subunit family